MQHYKKKKKKNKLIENDTISIAAENGILVSKTITKVKNSILIISNNKANFCIKFLFANPSVNMIFYSKKFSIANFDTGINFLSLDNNELSIQYWLKYFNEIKS